MIVNWLMVIVRLRVKLVLLIGVVFVIQVIQGLYQLKLKKFSQVIIRFIFNGDCRGSRISVSRLRIIVLRQIIIGKQCLVWQWLFQVVSRMCLVMLLFWMMNSRVVVMLMLIFRVLCRQSMVNIRMLYCIEISVILEQMMFFIVGLVIIVSCDFIIVFRLCLVGFVLGVGVFGGVWQKSMKVSVLRNVIRLLVRNVLCQLQIFVRYGSSVVDSVLFSGSLVWWMFMVKFSWVLVNQCDIDLLLFGCVVLQLVLMIIRNSRMVRQLVVYSEVQRVSVMISVLRLIISCLEQWLSSLLVISRLMIGISCVVDISRLICSDESCRLFWMNMVIVLMFWMKKQVQVWVKVVISRMIQWQCWVGFVVRVVVIG